MKHRKTGRILSRPRRQRKALLRTLLGSLVIHEKITITEAKAKEMKLHIDQIINKAKRARQNALERVALWRALSIDLPQMAVTKLNGSFTDKFEARHSGYIRIMKLVARPGDGARMAIIEFV